MTCATSCIAAKEYAGIELKKDKKTMAQFIRRRHHLAGQLQVELLLGLVSCSQLMMQNVYDYITNSTADKTYLKEKII